MIKDDAQEIYSKDLKSALIKRIIIEKRSLFKINKVC